MLQEQRHCASVIKERCLKFRDRVVTYRRDLEFLPKWTGGAGPRQNECRPWLSVCSGALPVAWSEALVLLGSFVKNPVLIVVQKLRSIRDLVHRGESDPESSSCRCIGCLGTAGEQAEGVKVASFWPRAVVAVFSAVGEGAVVPDRESVAGHREPDGGGVAGIIGVLGELVRDGRRPAEVSQRRRKRVEIVGRLRKCPALLFAHGRHSCSPIGTVVEGSAVIKSSSAIPVTRPWHLAMVGDAER